MKRKSLLYKSEVEYANFCLNHVEGCSHGCKYPCYAMNLAKRFGRIKTYNEWIKPKLVTNSLQLLEKEIPKYKDKIKFVHMNFMTDPFMFKQKKIIDMSLKIIKKMNENGIKVSTLTKGVYPEEIINDCSFSKENIYGITLISLNESFRSKWEPNAAIFNERISKLRRLHDSGLITWVSMEPYPTPNIIKQDLIKILEKIKFVDKIVFGRMNYNRLVTEYIDYKSFYNEMAEKVIIFCERNGIKYHIKEKTISGKIINAKIRTKNIFMQNEYATI
jgi:DNA repair photolyase